VYDGEVAKSSLIILTTSRSTRERLKKDLQADFELIEASSGAETLKLLQKKLPTAIVMDHSLEDFLTHQFIDKVRNNPVTRNLPFVLVSRESSLSFVEQAIRSGVSHYIGVPYEKKVFIEKLKIALHPGEIFPRESYFSLPCAVPTTAISYGRISYISNDGIHFETRLKLNPGDVIDFKSPLSSAIHEQSIQVRVTGVGSDVFYNYPYAVDAQWVDRKQAEKIGSWALAHRHLNSPKKLKILFVSANLELENKFSEVLDKSHYSARFFSNLESAVQAIPFLRPGGVVVDLKSWVEGGGGLQQRFLKLLSSGWIAFGDEKGVVFPQGREPFIAPGDVDSIATAVRHHFVVTPTDPNRIYFSKTLEDSRLQIFFQAKVAVMGEMGVTLKLQHEATPPCNLHLDLKIFTEQNIRNPFVRLWPPLQRLGSKESEEGKFKVEANSHFLGINDEQGQAIRKWLVDEELKERRKKIADVPPKLEPSEDKK
jgi:CheY-like chemotaxis protein